MSENSSESPLLGTRARAEQARQEGLTTDVTFEVGEEKKILKAHRMYLSFASPVFQAMFFGNMKEQHSQTIPIPNISSHVFEILLKYIYLEDSQLLQNEPLLVLIDVFSASHQYALANLTSSCGEELKKRVNAENFVEIINAATLFGCNELILHCKDFATKQKFLNFENLTRENLLVLLNRQFEISSELETFRSVEKWAKKECERKGLENSSENMFKIAHDAVRFIRFLTMSSADFAGDPCDSDILNQSEKLAILKILSLQLQSYNSVPFLKDFCSSSKPRKESHIHFRNTNREDPLIAFNIKNYKTLEFTLMSSNNCFLGSINFVKQAPGVLLLCLISVNGVNILSMEKKDFDSEEMLVNLKLEGGTVYNIAITLLITRFKSRVLAYRIPKVIHFNCSKIHLKLTDMSISIADELIATNVIESFETIC